MIPTLRIHFDKTNDGEQVILELALPESTSSLSYPLCLPYYREQVPLVLRALNARQFPDYPDKEQRLSMREDRAQTIATLRELGLWDDTIEAAAVDVHRRVGQCLGKALFPDAASKEYLHRLYDAATVERSGEIILDFASNCISLAALPWEAMYDGTQPILLARGIALSCIRVTVLDQPSTPSDSASTLFYSIGKHPRILIVTTDVQVDIDGRAFEENTRNKIREVLRDFQVDIDELPHATVDALHQRLDRGSTIHILDYFGHGVVTDEGGALLFEDAQGRRDLVTASRLAKLPNLPMLIVIWGCQSAWVDIHESSEGIAIALINAGAQAVVAMQFTTRMEAVANIAAPMFYRKLVETKSVQQAVAEMRRALYVIEPDGVSWFVPTLYLCQPDKRSFTPLDRSNLDNPFVSDKVYKDPKEFVGRRYEVEWFWERLRAGGNVSIVGASGSGKTALLMLAQIESEQVQWLGTKREVFSLSLEPRIKLVDAQLLLAHRLGGPRAKATDCQTLLRDRHIILLLDDLGQLSKGERGLEVRLWLRGLSQNRALATVQLVATSLKPLREIFRGDESDDYSPMHNVMDDILSLGAFSEEDAKQFVAKRLEGTPFRVDDFLDLMTKQMFPRQLQEACRARYDELRRKGY